MHTGGERAEAAQLDTIALSQGQGDPLEHGIDDPLNVAQVEMGMGIGKPIDQIWSRRGSHYIALWQQLRPL